MPSSTTVLPPLMTDEEVTAIEALFARKREEDQHNLPTVLEWGAGGSTLHFAPRAAVWHSIEHSGLWVKKLKPKLPHNVILHYVPVAGQMLRPKHSDAYPDGYEDAYHRYIDQARAIGDTFDVVLIDGRARFFCARHLINCNLLNPGAVVIIHDWKRWRYHNALTYYKLVEHFDTQQGLAFLTPA
jgi:hypothetical protein